MAQTFGALLRHLRRRSGLTQHELAERLGYSRSMVAALETDRRLPRVEAVVDEYIGALGLDELGDQANRLLTLAAQSRHVATPALPNGAAGYRRSMTDGQREMSNIAVPPLKLYGRERELALLSSQILEDDARLLTLVGSPGVGKTRLALELASRLEPYFADGARFVSLAGVTAPDSVAGALLEALGARAQSGSPWRALTSHLRAKRILLVLDNLEQVLTVGPMVANLVAECSGLSIVSTSRERLRLRAEHIALIKPLPSDAAVALFLERASAINPEMLWTDQAQPLIRAICDRLDNLPLAIELCAARVDYHSLQQILEQLQIHQLDTLVDGAADFPPHHRSLRAAIRSSYDLLNADERSLLQTIAVFTGGCTLEMAEDVWLGDCGEDGAQTEASAAASTDTVLRSLVAKNLVIVRQQAGEDRRLLLLESVREFARERADENGDLQTLLFRHLDAVLRFAHHAEPRLWSAERLMWLKRMRAESDNLHAALQWAFDNEAWSAIASLLLRFSEPFQTSVRVADLNQWFYRFLPYTHNLETDLKSLVKTIYCLGDYPEHMRAPQRAVLKEYQSIVACCVNPIVKGVVLLYGLLVGADSINPVEAAKEAILSIRAGATTAEYLNIYGYGFGREVMLPLALLLYGIQLADRGETVESEMAMQESLALQRAEFEGYFDPFCMGYLGKVALLQGKPTAAIRCYEKALDAAVANGHEQARVVWRAFLGNAILVSGDAEKARRILTLAWEECSDYGIPYYMQISAIFLSELAFAVGNIKEARQWLAESIALSARSAYDLLWRHIHRSMLAARLAACEGRNERAAQLYGFMQAYDDRIRIGPTGPVIDTAAPNLEEVRVRLGEEAFQRALEEGRQLPVEATLATLLDPID